MICAFRGVLCAHTVASIIRHRNIAHLPLLFLTQRLSSSSSSPPKPPLKLPLKLSDYHIDHSLNSVPFFHSVSLLAKMLVLSFITNDDFRKNFSIGSKHVKAVCKVSKLISEGNFKDLDHLVTQECIEVVQDNYSKMNDEEKESIAVDLGEVFSYRLMDIELIPIKKGNNDLLFAAVSIGIYGIKGHQVSKQNFREVTKDVDPSLFFFSFYRFSQEFSLHSNNISEWTIDELNQIPTGKPTIF